MPRTYLPYSGDIFSYGYGPEHNFYGDAQTPQAPSLPGTQPSVPGGSLAVPGNSVFAGAPQGGLPGGDNAPGAGAQNQALGTPDNPATTQTTGQMARDTMGAVGSMFSGGMGWGQIAGTALGLATGVPAGTLAGWGERAMNISRDARDMTNAHGYFGSGIPSQNAGGAAAQLAAEKAGIDSSGGMSWGGDGGMTTSGGSFDGDKGPSGGEGSPKGDGGGGWSDPGLYAGGGRVSGPGTGLSDSVPASIDGVQPARLATDEHVIPADVVAHLGDGSSSAGHARLKALTQKVRVAKTGKRRQPGPLNVAKTLGQLVR